MTQFISLKDIKQELTIFLRNQDILSIATRGVTTTSDLFSGTGAQQNFTLANVTVKNVRSITIGGSPVYFGTDYFVNYSTGVVTFNVAPVAGSNNISIFYDYGTSDKIFPDYPMPYLKRAQFPRIGFDIISATIAEVELGAGSNLATYRVQLNAYDIDKDNVEALIASIKQKIEQSKKVFYYFPFITPTGIGPLLPSPFGEDKVFQRSQDFEIKFVFDLL